MWALFETAFVFQNTEDKLFFLSSTESPFFLFASASSGYGPGLTTAGILASDLCVTPWSGCIHSLSALLFIHSHFFSSAWPEFSCRFTQRLGNTLNQVSIFGMTLHNNKTSTVDHSENQDHLGTKLKPARPKTWHSFLYSLLRRKRGGRLRSCVCNYTMKCLSGCKAPPDTHNRWREKEQLRIGEDRKWTRSCCEENWRSASNYPSEERKREWNTSLNEWEDNTEEPQE